MITAEIKVNGNMICHLIAVNEGYKSGVSDECKYRYEVYFPDTKDTQLINGKVTHHRDEGALILIKKIIDSYVQSNKPK